MRFLSSGGFLCSGEVKPSQVTQLTWWWRLQAVSGPSGENGHHLLQTGISHGGMPSTGPWFWIPLALSTAHRPSVLPHPRVYFGFPCWRMRSLLSHLCPPWSYLFIYLFIKNLFLSLRNGSKLYSLSFSNSEWQRWRRKEDVARFCHRLWHSSSSSLWVVCLWAQLFGL